MPSYYWQDNDNILQKHLRKNWCFKGNRMLSRKKQSYDKFYHDNMNKRITISNWSYDAVPSCATHYLNNKCNKIRHHRRSKKRRQLLKEYLDTVDFTL